MFRSLAVLAAATYLGAAHAAANMEDMTVAEVQQLLGDWELQAAFGDYFQRLRVDGDMLRHDLTPEHIDLAACPDASGAHVLKLFRKLKASAPVESSSSASPAGAGAPARRSLASIGTGKSGISIARDDSMIALGVESDVMLSRTADGGMLLAPDVSVEGTLAVPTVDSLTVNGTATYFDETQSTHVFVGPNPVTLQQGILVTSTFTTGAEYELEFEINPYGTVAGWSNVMHFTATNDNCCDYGERIPAMWMVSGTSKMMIVAGNNDTANAAYTMLTGLPQGEWTHFLVRVVDDAGEVYINGTMVGSISTDQRKPHDNVEVYMSDPWHTAAKAKLRNVRYQRLAYHHSAMYNEFSQFDFVESTEQRVEDLEDLAIEHEETLETLETTYWQRIIEAVPDAEENWHTFVGPVAITAQSNVPATGTFTTGAEYELIFDVKPYGTVNNWNNLIHFTASGENCCNYGDRIPAIWFYKDSTRLHIIAGSNSSGNGGFHPTTLLPTDSWTTVRLRLVNDTGLVYYNDVLMGTIDSDIRMPHDNTQVWVGDPWNLSPKAYLRNFKYRIISYHHSHFYDIATTADVDRILNPQ